MIFPENNQFLDFFNSLTNEKGEKTNSVKHILYEGTSAVDQGNIRKLIPEKAIYVDSSVQINLSGIQKKIDSYLKSIGHVSNSKIVNSIIYMLSFVRKNNETIKTINHILDKFTTADLNQFLVYPIGNEGFDLKLNGFNIGTIDSNKIGTYCKKFGTDYYSKYSDLLINKFGITRNYFSIKIVNTEILTNSVVKYDHKYIEAMFSYFDEVSMVYQKNFYSKFAESQEILNFLCETYFDPNHWSIALHPTNFISIFLNIAKKKDLGWIVPKMQGVTLNLGSRLATEKLSELKTNFGFIDFGNNEIDLVFKKFVSFCAKGSKFITENRISESFLHYVIALDLLLGDKDSNTSTVSNRTAFLIFKSQELDYDKAVKKVRGFYNKRSKYVHEGLEIDFEFIDRIREVCLTVFSIYLQLNKTGQTQTLSTTAWLKRIDLGTALLEASEELTPEILSKCGVQ
jgi:hypothetical protein